MPAPTITLAPDDYAPIYHVYGPQPCGKAGCLTAELRDRAMGFNVYALRGLMTLGVLSHEIDRIPCAGCGAGGWLWDNLTQQFHDGRVVEDPFKAIMRAAIGRASCTGEAP